jgi:hypothetical protein
MSLEDLVRANALSRMPKRLITLSTLTTKLLSFPLSSIDFSSITSGTRSEAYT